MVVFISVNEFLTQMILQVLKRMVYRDQTEEENSLLGEDHIQHFSSGRRAFHFLNEYQEKKVPVKLLILQTQLPGMSGLDILEGLQVKGIKIPFLVIGSHRREIQYIKDRFSHFRGGHFLPIGLMPLKNELEEILREQHMKELNIKMREAPPPLVLKKKGNP